MGDKALAPGKASFCVHPQPNSYHFTLFLPASLSLPFHRSSQCCDLSVSRTKQDPELLLDFILCLLGRYLRFSQSINYCEIFDIISLCFCAFREESPADNRAYCTDQLKPFLNEEEGLTHSLSLSSRSEDMAYHIYRFRGFCS
jgi:hypothetical protein